MRLLSVNTGVPRSINAKSGQTGIFRTPVSGPVRVGTLGLSGDHILDTENHGGRLCCLNWRHGRLRAGWSESQTTPAPTVDHVWKACFWLLRLVWAVTLERE